jgi:hypothetical protein
MSIYTGYPMYNSKRDLHSLHYRDSHSVTPAGPDYSVLVMD